jgi:hypothetical protein
MRVRVPEAGCELKMNLMVSKELEIDGKRYAVAEAAIASLIEKGTFNGDAAVVEGRVAALSPWNAVVAVSKDGKIVARSFRQPDSEPANDESYFRLQLPQPSIQDPLDTYSGMRYFAVDDPGVAAYEITRKSDAYYFDLNLNEHNFHVLIQDPSSRIKDKASLVYFSRWFLHRYREEFTFAASCYCTIGYRLMETKSLDRLRELVDDCQYLFSMNIDLSKRFDFRWQVSLSLFCGYAELIGGDMSAASIHFDRIFASMNGLAHTPQMVTNTLKAILLLGFIAESAEPSAGIKYWAKAVEAIRLASGAWEYENYYSFSELAQSVLLARECKAAALLSKRKIDPGAVSVRIFPDQTGVSFANLGFPANAFGFHAMFPDSGIRIDQ